VSNELLEKLNKVAWELAGGDPEKVRDAPYADDYIHDFIIACHPDLARVFTEMPEFVSILTYEEPEHALGGELGKIGWWCVLVISDDQRESVDKDVAICRYEEYAFLLHAYDIGYRDDSDTKYVHIRVKDYLPEETK